MSTNASAPAQRIAQFRKMAADDPGNELAHLSLGRELLAAGQEADAAESFRRAIEINDGLSKAYELLADALVRLDRGSDAVVVMKRGAQVAAARGDFRVRDALVEKLRTRGEALPEGVEGTAAGGGGAMAVGEGEVLDARTGKPGPRLPRPPMKGMLGRVIHDNVSAASWREWIGMGTKVINELRLPLSDPKARQVYDDHLVDFLNIREHYEEARRAETSPPPA